jgi:hypothetical protein
MCALSARCKSWVTRQHGTTTWVIMSMSHGVRMMGDTESGVLEIGDGDTEEKSKDESDGEEP